MNPQYPPLPGQPPLPPPGQQPFPAAGSQQPYSPVNNTAPINNASNVLVPPLPQPQPPLSAAPPSQPLQPIAPVSVPERAANKPSAAKSQVVDSIKNAVNVLVTVSTNPSVDQLSTAIGLTILINKLNKHGTAVFSGEIPSTIEFLQPEQTIEKDTNSLRDFIIALDKAKADKLRYKVEDRFVKIFITPYHTSLSEDDLEFSQGDFNIDVVLALGVKKKEELDQAITAHGRILHDASVISINNTPGGELGTINLVDTKASSLSEIVVELLDSVPNASKSIDAQIATAFLTGIVAETERFSNDKTTSLTMNTAAKLMTAGANQQLIATKLEEPAPIPKDDGVEGQNESHQPPSDTPKPVQSKDGSLQIEHDETEGESKTLAEIEEEVAGDGNNLEKIHIDEEGTLRRSDEIDSTVDSTPKDSHSTSRLVTQPPTLGGALSANTKREAIDPFVDPLASSSAVPDDTLSHSKSKIVDPRHKYDDETLKEIEEDVDSPHVKANPPLGGAQTLQSSPTQPAPLPVPVDSSQVLPPIAALNAQPVDLIMAHNNQNTELPPVAAPPPQYPTQLVPPASGLPPDTTAGSVSATAPPPVPPPFMPPIPQPTPGEQAQNPAPPSPQI